MTCRTDEAMQCALQFLVSSSQLLPKSESHCWDLCSCVWLSGATIYSSISGFIIYMFDNRSNPRIIGLVAACRHYDVTVKGESHQIMQTRTSDFNPMPPRADRHTRVKKENGGDGIILDKTLSLLYKSALLFGCASFFRCFE